MGNYKYGLCSVSFRKHSAEEVIKGAAETGLDCIEWGSDVHAMPGDIPSLKKIVELQKEYGISCSSYGTYFYLMRDSIEELKSYIDAAKILGTNILRLWCGEKASNAYTPKEKEEFFAECKRAAELALVEGVILCMESHNGTYCDTAESSIELVEAINLPSFRLYWQHDIHVSDEESLAMAKKLCPYVVNIHVFYWVNLKHRPLAEGIDAWREFLSVFPKDKTLLLEFMHDGRMESLAAEVQSLKKITK